MRPAKTRCSMRHLTQESDHTELVMAAARQSLNAIQALQ
jgi:hypothetical protein